jgi:hypothetical protein
MFGKTRYFAMSKSRTNFGTCPMITLSLAFVLVTTVGLSETSQAAPQSALFCQSETLVARALDLAVSAKEIKPNDIAAQINEENGGKSVCEVGQFTYEQPKVMKTFVFKNAGVVMEVTRVIISGQYDQAKNQIIPLEKQVRYVLITKKDKSI